MTDNIDVLLRDLSYIDSGWAATFWIRRRNGSRRVRFASVLNARGWERSGLVIRVRGRAASHTA